MPISFHAIAGQVALIEPDDWDRAGPDRLSPLTGLVDDNDGVLTIMGLSSPDLADGSEVVVSVFAPEALYRIRAAAHWVLLGRLAIDPIYDVERIERRSWPRHALRLNVTLIALDGPDDDLTAIAGRTLDLGMAGMQVETIGQLPPGADVTVMLSLPDGCLMVRTTVVSAQTGDDSCEYRLAFDPLDDVDAARLMAIVGRRVAMAGAA